MPRSCLDYPTLRQQVSCLVTEASRPQQNTLALFVYGLLTAWHSHLPNIALHLPREGTLKNAQQRLERFLQNPAVTATDWYKGVARAVLARFAGLPIATAWSPFESANHWYVITVENDWRKKLNVGSAKLCRSIGDALLETKAGMGTPKYIVVNDDIDPTNLKEVVWAFATRNHPGSQGETVFNDENTNPLVAFLSNAEKMSMHTPKVIYNCLPPDEFGDKLPERSSFAYGYPKELQEQILRNWGTYGFR